MKSFLRILTAFIAASTIFFGFLGLHFYDNGSSKSGKTLKNGRFNKALTACSIDREYLEALLGGASKQCSRLSRNIVRGYPER